MITRKQILAGFSLEQDQFLSVSAKPNWVTISPWPSVLQVVATARFYSLLVKDRSMKPATSPFIFFRDCESK